ncbi:MAG: hypothetical protein ABIK09_20960 [Pseudomonadota bacterium]
MGAQKNRLDPEARARMRSLVERFMMPAHLARRVASGELALSDALLSMQREELAGRLLAEDRIDSQGASLVRRGCLTADAAEFMKRVRDHKARQGYGVSRLDELLGQDVGVALVGGRLVQGRLVEAETYQIILETADGMLALDKHDVKLVFRAAHRKRLLKRGVTWGAPEERLEPEALRSRSSRRDVKARQLLSAMEGEGVVTWTTAEGDRLRGRVTGFNRFEVVFETAQGDEVLLFRHAFGGMDLRVPGA